VTSKSEIRAQVRQARDNWQQKSPADFTAASAAIGQRLLGLSNVVEAKTWFVYVSTRSEVATRDLLRTLLERRYSVAVPLMVGAGQMIARQIHSLDELRLGPRGILEPAVGEPLHGLIDVCVCPGLAFSQYCDRLGWGPGYYDRFLATQPHLLAVGLAFECQMVSQLPCEPHDHHMDLIITEKRVIRRV
jgi:5-formyltetrahydrofolate cyclo-ligase